MTHRFADITFTKNVKAAQTEYEVRKQNQRLHQEFGPNDQLTARETEFIKLRDSFYLATVNEDGWPYIQHRGGPAGFLKVLDPNQLAYADFRGNQQLITTGNSLKNSRCSIILMDYPHRKRLKILGHLKAINKDAVDSDLFSKVNHQDYRAHTERVMLIDVVAFDWNCPQHITPRYTENEIKSLRTTQA